MTLPLALTPGTVIGNNYIIGSLINSGGFGAVYRATDIGEGNRPCAIKETYDVTPAARRQALMEVSVLFTIQNEHLPQVYDALEANGRFYLVMQLIEGQNLLQLLKDRTIRRGLATVGEQEPNRVTQGPCSEQEVLSWLLPIVDTLQELHSRAIVHRDIKPANILLTPSHITVLVDFGLTKLYDAHNDNTQTLVRAVSAGFSPLEQYTGRTGPPADIYAMAATMYLLLTNRLPPPAFKRSTHDELIAPRLLNPILSPHVERALLKALAVQVDSRYQTMREFAEALRPPTFNAHADTTIVARPIAPTSPNYPLHVPVSSQQPVAARTYAGTPPPQSANQRTPPAVYPVVPPPLTIPAGYVMVPQASVVTANPLPTPFSQGCLFGLIQAILAVMLVLALKKEASFYLATAMGFLFYALAGFMTTWRGGRALRGGWAGLWAGITSAIMFWVVLFIGLFILLAQHIETDTTNAQKHGMSPPRNELNRAWQTIQPIYPGHAATSSQASFTTLIVLVVGGMLAASILGWLGGRVGTAKHQEKMAKKQPQQVVNVP